MAIKALENNIPSGHKVCIFSFDKTLKPLEFALQNAGELKYLLGLERQIEIFVGYGCTVDKKLHTTVASNSLDALKKPLDKAWLTERVRVSHSAAPIRTIPHEIAPLSEGDYELLLKHPQFAPHESRQTTSEVV